jgi:ketosteroid isomerase-like protein
MTPREVFERAHALVRSYDIRYVDCFAEDGVLVFPFAPPGVPKEVRGREAIRALMAPRYDAMRAAGRKHLEYENVRVHETRDPEVVIAEFEALVTTPNGETTRRAFIHVLRVRGDAIVEHRDYFDSYAMAERLRAT